MRTQFTFYASFWDSIKRLRRKDDRLSALEAIIDYALNGEERPMTDVAEGIFILVKPTLDTAERKSHGGKTTPREAQDKDKTTTRPQQEKRKEKEKEKEIEIENYMLTRTGARSFDDHDLQCAFDDWLAYKREKRQQYKPTGLKTLIAEIQRNADTYGADAVVALIRESMAANWQGIAFDRLSRTAPKQRTVGQPGTVPETPRTSPLLSDIERNRAMLEELRKA